MNHIRIINKGKRPWDLGCPHCNFQEWQAKKGQAKAEGKAETKAIPRKRADKHYSDGLGSIPGIGPKTKEKLALAGIKTLQDLIKAETLTLAEKTGLSQKKVATWQAAAKA